jgi:chaperone BCS1
LRPGRIDVRIHFSLASKKHAEEMFLQAFGNQSETKQEDVDDTKRDELKHMASVFAKAIPEEKLSPAEIQGFLMNWKKKPTEAVANIEEWVKERMLVDSDKA